MTVRSFVPSSPPILAPPITTSSFIANAVPLFASVIVGVPDTIVTLNFAPVPVPDADFCRIFVNIPLPLGGVPVKPLPPPIVASSALIPVTTGAPSAPESPSLFGADKFDTLVIL